MQILDSTCRSNHLKSSCLILVFHNVVEFLMTSRRHHPLIQVEFYRQCLPLEFTVGPSQCERSEDQKDWKTKPKTQTHQRTTNTKSGDWETRKSEQGPDATCWPERQVHRTAFPFRDEERTDGRPSLTSLSPSQRTGGNPLRFCCIIQFTNQPGLLSPRDRSSRHGHYYRIIGYYRSRYCCHYKWRCKWNVLILRHGGIGGVSFPVVDCRCS